VEQFKPFSLASIQSLSDSYSPFFKEVRKRFLFTLIVFALATIAGFVFYEKIVAFLIGAFNLREVNIVFTSPFQFINLAVSCGIAVGLIVSFPLLLFQLLSFLKPALRKKEYNMVMTLLPVSIFLFVVGFAFGIMIMKWQIQLFLTQAAVLGIGNVLDISKLLTTVLVTSSLMGISFQFPIVLLPLLKFGVIKHAQIKKVRMWIYLGSFLFAVLLPVDSILADLFLALPLIILFEATLLFSHGKKK
jgi:sec-independent protein translocase protein TatC